jgi:predicted nucleic acid-binding protein
MTSHPQRIYIDTMVFLNQLINVTHPLHLKSKKFFYDVQNQKYQGITSSFTRSEYLGLIKELIADQIDISPGTPNKRCIKNL